MNFMNKSETSKEKPCDQRRDFQMMKEKIKLLELQLLDVQYDEGK